MVSLQLGYLHVIIGDTLLLKLGDWQKKMQNCFNLITCKCNYLNVYPSRKTQQTTIFSIQKNWHISLDLEKFLATDIMYIVCLWHFVEAYKKKKMCTEQNGCGSFECPYAHSIQIN